MSLVTGVRQLVTALQDGLDLFCETGNPQGKATGFVSVIWRLIISLIPFERSCLSLVLNPDTSFAPSLDKGISYPTYHLAHISNI